MRSFLSVFAALIYVTCFAQTGKNNIQETARRVAGNIAKNGSNAVLYETYMKNEEHALNLKKYDFLKKRFYGKNDTPHSLVVYSDFACAHCPSAIKDLKNLVDKSDGRINLYFIMFPLDKSCNPSVTGRYSTYSCYAAKAALCAEKNAKFWETASILYDSRPADNEASEFTVHKQIETKLGIKDVEQCIKSKWAAEKLAAETSVYRNFKIAGTPTILLDNRKIGPIYKNRDVFMSFLNHLDGIKK